MSQEAPHSKLLADRLQSLQKQWEQSLSKAEASLRTNSVALQEWSDHANQVQAGRVPSPRGLRRLSSPNLKENSTSAPDTSPRQYRIPQTDTELDDLLASLMEKKLKSDSEVNIGADVRRSPTLDRFGQRISNLPTPGATYLERKSGSPQPRATSPSKPSDSRTTSRVGKLRQSAERSPSPSAKRTADMVRRTSATDISEKLKSREATLSVVLTRAQSIQHMLRRLMDRFDVIDAGQREGIDTTGQKLEAENLRKDIDNQLDDFMNTNWNAMELGAAISTNAGELALQAQEIEAMKRDMDKSQADVLLAEAKMRQECNRLVEAAEREVDHYKKLAEEWRLTLSRERALFEEEKLQLSSQVESLKERSTAAVTNAQDAMEMSFRDLDASVRTQNVLETKLREKDEMLASANKQLESLQETVREQNETIANHQRKWGMSESYLTEMQGRTMTEKMKEISYWKDMAEKLRNDIETMRSRERDQWSEQEAKLKAAEAMDQEYSMSKALIKSLQDEKDEWKRREADFKRKFQQINEWKSEVEADHREKLSQLEKARQEDERKLDAAHSEINWWKKEAQRLQVVERTKTVQGRLSMQSNNSKYDSSFGLKEGIIPASPKGGALSELPLARSSTPYRPKTPQKHAESVRIENDEYNDPEAIKEMARTPLF